jgi:hypothetical protein
MRGQTYEWCNYYSFNLRNTYCHLRDRKKEIMQGYEELLLMLAIGMVLLLAVLDIIF